MEGDGIEQRKNWKSKKMWVWRGWLSVWDAVSRTCTQVHKPKRRYFECFFFQQANMKSYILIKTTAALLKFLLCIHLFIFYQLLGYWVTVPWGKPTLLFLPSNPLKPIWGDSKTLGVCTLEPCYWILPLWGGPENYLNIRETSNCRHAEIHLSLFPSCYCWLTGQHMTLIHRLYLEAHCYSHNLQYFSWPLMNSGTRIDQ